MVSKEKKTPSVYNYETMPAWLTAVIESKKLHQKSFSIRLLAKQLKIKSPSLITMVLRGERQPSIELVHKIAAYLKMPAAETTFLEALVGLQRAANVNEQTRYMNDIRKMRPSSTKIAYRMDMIEMMTKWYAVVILEMTQLTDFQENIKKIKQQIGAVVTEDMVADAIKGLKKHKLVEADATGTIRKVADFIRSTVNIPSLAIRSFHKQVLLRAHAAIDAQSIDERYFTTLTIAIPQHKIKLAGELMSRFRDDFMAEMTGDLQAPDEIYHLSMQFFRATEKPISNS